MLNMLLARGHHVVIGVRKAAFFYFLFFLLSPPFLLNFYKIHCFVSFTDLNLSESLGDNNDYQISVLHM